MKTDLKKYQPYIYEEVLETDSIIETEEIELDLINKIFKTIKENQYIKTASSERINEWAKLLGISSDLTIEEKRTDILFLLNRDKLITKKTIKKSLEDIFLDTDFDYEIDNIKLIFNLITNFIDLDDEDVPNKRKKRALTFLRRVIPQNVLLINNTEIKPEESPDGHFNVFGSVSTHFHNGRF